MPIVLNGSGTVTGISVGGLPDGIVDGDTLASGVGGKVLQVVQKVKSDAFSTGASDATFIDITNFNQAITPSSSSNKVLVRVNIGKCACSTNQRQSNFRVFRGSTEIGRGDSNGSRLRCAFSIYHGGMNSSGGGWSGSWEFLDTPNTTSSTTYKVAMSGHNGDTHGINGAFSDNANNTDAPQSRTISTITLMEVS